MTAGELHDEIVRRLVAAVGLADATEEYRLAHFPGRTREAPSDKERRFTLRPRRVFLLTPEQGGTGSCEYRIEYEITIFYNASSNTHVQRALDDAVVIIEEIWRLTTIEGVTRVEETNQDMDDQAGPYEHRREFNVDFDPNR